MNATRQNGMSIVEALVVLAVVGISVAIAIPAFSDFFHRRQVRSAATTVQTLTRYARLKAIKEKVSYRIIFHDDAAATPNLIEVQNDQGGSFVTLTGHVYPNPDGVAILGSGSTDSMDTVTLGRRGECNTGKVFLEGRQGMLEVVNIAPTCGASIL